MKKSKGDEQMKKILLLFLILAIASSTNVAASGNSFVSSYNPVNNSVLVFGRVEELQGEGITIIITHEGTGKDSLSDSSLPSELRILEPDENGYFEDEVLLPLTMQGGKYHVFADIALLEMESSFNRPDLNALDALKGVNQSNASQLPAVLSSKADVLGVNLDIFSRNSENICKKLLKARPNSGFKSIGDFYSAYLTAEASVLLNSDVKGTIDKYRAVLGINYDTETEMLKAEEKGLLNALLQDYEITDEPFDKAFNKFIFLTKVLMTDRYNTLRALVEANGSLYGFNVDSSSDYARVKYKDDVYIYMLSNGLSNLKILDDVLSLFDTAVSKALAKENDSKPVSTGGRGGSGGGNGISTGLPSEIVIDGNAVNSSKTGFSDMNGHWAEDTVNTLANLGIITGFPDKTFLPENPVSRAEFVKMISAALNISPVYQDVFKDTLPEHWYYSYVGGAYNAGLIQGNYGYFYPDNKIIRQEAAVIIYRSVIDKISQANYSFKDSDQIADYASEAVETLAGAGIIKGYDGFFNPNALMTRAEAVSIISNVLSILPRR
jgi:hypothetical protein